MEDQQKNNHKRSNIPDTDRWILYDSKSNPGRRYYYNPVTKQTLWHHTDDEINKKVKRTLNVANVESNNIITDKQFDMPKKHEEGSASEFKIEINTIHPSNPLNLWDVPHMQPTVPLIQQTLPTAFINSPFLCNQIITPPQTALVNLQSGSLNTLNQMPNSNTIAPNFEINNYQSTNPVKTFANHKSENTTYCSTDLRNKLKNKSCIKHHSRNYNINANKETKVNVSWDDEKVKSVLAYLRCYAPPDTKTDSWYIVPDTYVVMNHSRLLNQMVVLDGKRCRLKIPHSVKMELKNIEINTASEAISRFVRFYCTQIDSEIQVQNKKDIFNDIVNTCQELSKDNYHVVLLCSTDKAFLSYKRKIKTPVFTVNKIRELQSQGRLIIPRSSTILHEFVPKHIFSDETKDNNKIISEESPVIIMDNNMSGQKSSLPEIINKESQLTLRIHNTETTRITVHPHFEKLSTEKVEQNIFSCKSNSQSINVKSNTSHSNSCASKSTKKRIIKLKLASEEGPTSGNSLKRKRWSAKKLNLESRSITSQYIPNDEVIESISENKDIFPETYVEDRDNFIVEPLVEHNDYCDALSSNVKIASSGNSNPNKNNEDKSTFTIHCKSTSSMFPNCESETIDKTDFENTARENRWIPKFMQIMEGVLLRVLDQDTHVSLNETPLQRLHKATLDIIKNFNHCCLIVDAANKLSMKITQSKDSNGAIKLDQKFFDEIYIYSIKLVEALQGISPSVDDILRAKRLLENLRGDNPIIGEHNCHNILINVATDQPKITRDDNYTEDDKIFMDSTNSNIECTTGVESTSGIKSNNENCCLNTQKNDDTNEEENVYFTALKLRKRGNEQVVEDADISGVIENKVEQLITDEQKNEDNSIFDSQSREYLLNDTAGENDVSDIKNDETMNHLYKNTCNESLDGHLESKPENKNIEYSEQTKVFHDSPCEGVASVSSINNDLCNEKFKCFIGMFLKEIREALIVCAQNFEMCISHQNDVNNDLSGKLGEVHAHLYSIQRSLDSILHRDTGDVNNNFKSLLRKAGFDIKLDPSVCDEYRDIVQKCRNEVNAFLNILERKFSCDQNCDLSLPSPQYV